MKFGLSRNVRCSIVEQCTRERFYETLRSPLVATTCGELEDALEKKRRGELTPDEYDHLKSQLKRRLPVFVPHALFRQGRRRNDDAIPSGLSIYDKDHIQDPRGWWQQKLDMLRQKHPEAARAIVLAHITPSTEGLRLFFVIPRGMSLQEAQQWMAGRLEDPDYDECCKDYARASFAVPEDYMLFINEERLFGEEAGEGQEAVVNEQPVVNKEPVKNERPVVSKEPAVSADTGTDVPAAALKKQLIAFDLFRETAGLKQVDIDRRGSRHTSLKAIMSAGASRVMSEEEMMQVVARRMPSFAGEADCRQLVHDFYNKYGDTTRPFSQQVIRVNARAEELAGGRGKTGEEERGQKEASAGGADTGTTPLAATSQRFFSLALPRLVSLLVSRTPAIYQPAVAHAVFPSLAAHLCGVRFRYIDNVEHEATLMCCLMAGTGAGKSCVTQPINHIMADIRERDRANLQREKEWKAECNGKGANKDRKPRPTGLIIQEIDADMTNPAFVMRTAEAEGHFLYTALNEIDQFDALRGSGGQQFRIMCLAFDPDNQYGQTRVGQQSVTERVTVRFNWNASTTIVRGQRYFSKVLTDGPLSRINFCTIPEREIGDDIPVYGTYGDVFDRELKPFIDNLTAARGLIDCPEAFDLARRLYRENAEFSRLSQSRTYENFTFRANVIAYLKACVLYVANGCQWEPEIEEFVRWSEQYDLACKMQFFGPQIERAQSEGEKSSRRGPRNLLQLLPDTFSYHDAERIRTEQGMDTEQTAHMLSTWKKRGYIKALGEDGKTDGSLDNYVRYQYHSFEKLKFRSCPQ